MNLHTTFYHQRGEKIMPKKLLSYKYEESKNALIL